MKLTTKGEYGLICLLRIAKSNALPLSIEEICKGNGLSRDYAEQLLLRLRRKGIINSIKGPGGGYVLRRKPKNISVKDVLSALENRPFEIICKRLKQNKFNCRYDKNCKLKILWKEINNRLERVLEKTSLKQLI